VHPLAKSVIQAQPHDGARAGPDRQQSSAAEASAAAAPAFPGNAQAANAPSAAQHSAGTAANSADGQQPPGADHGHAPTGDTQHDVATADVPPPPPPAAGWGPQSQPSATTPKDAISPATLPAAAGTQPPVDAAVIAQDTTPAVAAAPQAWVGSNLDDAEELQAALMEEGQGMADISGSVDLYGDLQPGGTPASIEQAPALLAPPLPANTHTAENLEQPDDTAAAAPLPASATGSAAGAASDAPASVSQPPAGQALPSPGLPSFAAVQLAAAVIPMSGAAQMPATAEPAKAPAAMSAAEARAARAEARAEAPLPARDAAFDAGLEELSMTGSEESGDDDAGSGEEDELEQARRDDARRRAVRVYANIEDLVQCCCIISSSRPERVSLCVARGMARSGSG